VNAIAEPSGDQRGAVSFLPEKVSWRSPPPGTSSIQRARARAEPLTGSATVKTRREPSGEKARSFAARSPTARRSSVCAGVRTVRGRGASAGATAAPVTATSTSSVVFISWRDYLSIGVPRSRAEREEERAGHRWRSSNWFRRPWPAYPVHIYYRDAGAGRPLVTARRLG
jgi:hypothetical protein